MHKKYASWAWAALRCVCSDFRVDGAGNDSATLPKASGLTLSSANSANSVKPGYGATGAFRVAHSVHDPS